MMKWFFLIFLFPAVAFAQTIHMEKDKVVYKGTVEIANKGEKELIEAANRAIKKEVLADPQTTDGNQLHATGEIKLSSTTNTSRKLIYAIQLTIKNGSYKYRIDSVYIMQKQRGIKKPVMQSAEDLFKGMDISGNVAINTEKQLNEIDMDLEQLLDLIQRDMEN